MAENWLVGRKEISSYMHVSWDTVQYWRRDHGCPIYTTPGGRPSAFAHELDQWLISRSKEKEEREGRTPIVPAEGSAT